MNKLFRASVLGTLFLAAVSTRAVPFDLIVPRQLTVATHNATGYGGVSFSGMVVATSEIIDFGVNSVPPFLSPVASFFAEGNAPEGIYLDGFFQSYPGAVPLQPGEATFRAEASIGGLDLLRNSFGGTLVDPASSGAAWLLSINWVDYLTTGSYDFSITVRIGEQQATYPLQIVFVPNLVDDEFIIRIDEVIRVSSHGAEVNVSEKGSSVLILCAAFFGLLGFLRISNV